MVGTSKKNPNIYTAHTVEQIKLEIERLTQPDHIAVVYSQEKEKQEYLQYAYFLKNNLYIHHSHEELEIEELQGVSGLKALRFKVNILSS